MSENSQRLMQVGDIQAYLRKDTIGLAKFLLVLTPVGYFFWLWFFSDASWLHPEPLGAAVYIWNNPGSENIFHMLRKVFDWKAFDPNVNRVRPLNDLAEVIDSIARPYLARFIGPSPSITPVAMLTVILSPAALFFMLRRALGQSMLALVLVVIFISSIGFLSVTVAYIHPAKKLNILFLCMALYFAQCHADGTARNASFVGLMVALYASFFSDELGLANFVICGVLFWPSLLHRASLWQRIAYLSLPLLFLGMVEWGLPAMYIRWGVHGAWNALADKKKYEVFAYLTEPEFWRAALIQTARSVLSTIGVKMHVAWTEGMIIFVMIALSIASAIHGKKRGMLLLQDRIILAVVVIFLSSIYSTLLDWYPFPHEVSYLGSFNYYYHSAMVIPVVLWLGFLWCDLVIPIAERHRIFCDGRRAIWGFSYVVSVVVLVANFAMFGQVNQMVQIIHTYPWSTQSMYRTLKQMGGAEPYVPNNEAIVMEFPTERKFLAERFDKALRSVFGHRATSNNFYLYFEMFKKTSIWQPPYLHHLVQAYYPYHAFNVMVRDDPVSDREQK